MTIGIDALNFFVPPYYVEMTELAEARQVDPAKYTIGIGQSQMAVAPRSQDIITLAASAAETILTVADRQAIDLIIIGTESSIDESKAAAVVLHGLLKLQPFARAIEIKEACYGATAGLQLGKDYLAQHPGRKVLVVATDIAKYGLNSGGEPTQGAGAVALLLSHQPKILALASDNVTLTGDIYDFWRPTHHEYPCVDGHLSNATYLDFFQKVWTEHQRQTRLTLTDYAALCFHIPYTKMGRKALQTILPTVAESEQERLLTRYEESIQFSRRVGNLYTGSLYLGLCSLLENSQALHAGDRLGFFSYGSGAVGEFFSGTLVPGYQEHLHGTAHQKMLDARQRLTVPQYEKVFAEKILPQTNYTFQDDLPFSIKKVHEGIRYYNVPE
ncbi:hydroxymethylglutaryl-CoA synthase [Enterococcus nangangensis]|uniref:hydroxymethylglutaryl-CoA synthase n=1 Tax=Enterococcus nangangensis TaxID=2559926 RepID=UPI0010F6A972|nr:hydroxymethylglutaryl-CoA synthase [Enterococcus nangangensis]